MLRSAAKNHASVAVVTDPDDYQRVIDSLQAGEHERQSLRYDLAVRAFEHTAHYDGTIANFLGKRTGTASHEQPAEFPRTLSAQFTLNNTLRYGENPHQHAAFIAPPALVPDVLQLQNCCRAKRFRITTSWMPMQLWRVCGNSMTWPA